MEVRFTAWSFARTPEPRMVAKLAVIIIVIGATFVALLVNRQQRIDVVAEIARAHLRVDAHRKTAHRLHAAVAESVRPAELRAALSRLPIEWQPIRYRFDASPRPFAPESEVATALPTAPTGDDPTRRGSSATRRRPPT